MKFTFFAAALSVAMLMGCSHVQTVTQLPDPRVGALRHGGKRIPASIKDVGVIGPDGDVNPSQKFPCGLKGSIDERIRDCSYQLTSQEEGFLLVTRTKEFKEIHKDTKTGLLWGDRLPSTMNPSEAKKACKADLAEVAKISEVTWRLPSKAEYEEGEKNGIRKALPNMNYWFWTSSVHRDYSNDAWLFNGNTGDIAYVGRYYYDVSLRCVAR